MYALGCGIAHGLLTIGLLGIGTMPMASITGILLLVPMIVLCAGKRVSKIGWLTVHRYMALCLAVCTDPLCYEGMLEATLESNQTKMILHTATDRGSYGFESCRGYHMGWLVYW